MSNYPVHGMGQLCTCLYVGITWAEVDLGAAVMGAKGVAWEER